MPSPPCNSPARWVGGRERRAGGWASACGDVWVGGGGGLSRCSAFLCFREGFVRCAGFGSLRERVAPARPRGAWARRDARAQCATNATAKHVAEERTRLCFWASLCFRVGHESCAGFVIARAPCACTPARSVGAAQGASAVRDEATAKRVAEERTVSAHYVLWTMVLAVIRVPA